MNKTKLQLEHEIRDLKKKIVLLKDGKLGCNAHLSEQWHCGDRSDGYLQLCPDCNGDEE